MEENTAGVTTEPPAELPAAPPQRVEPPAPAVTTPAAPAKQSFWQRGVAKVRERVSGLRPAQPPETPTRAELPLTSPPEPIRQRPLYVIEDELKALWNTIDTAAPEDVADLVRQRRALESELSRARSEAEVAPAGESLPAVTPEGPGVVAGDRLEANVPARPEVAGEPAPARIPPEWPAGETTSGIGSPYLKDTPLNDHLTAIATSPYVLEPQRQSALENARRRHRNSVADAVARGIPVPDEVMKDYPDLVPVPPGPIAGEPGASPVEDGESEFDRLVRSLSEPPAETAEISTTPAEGEEPAEPADQPAPAGEPLPFTPRGGRRQAQRGQAATESDLSPEEQAAQVETALNKLMDERGVTREQAIEMLRLGEI
ncbi:MAG: hypothetical protein HY377_01495 [Candidatus Blackburnbacteria bacterium]|nr:hypothetical protein [Candidatus Blackburnbacteria bacterium]